MRNVAYISIGSNMGNRVNFFKQAVQMLESYPSIKIENVSSLYETDPVGYVDQDNFLNAAIKIRTGYDPRELLRICQEIELLLGRKREIHWGPRTVDLDILLYNQENIESENLSVPHPRMLERPFVLIPLSELDPHLMLPKMNRPLHQIVADINDKEKEGVRLWKRKNGVDVFGLLEN
ncbi:2-amino-4-hydroxy-6-hydroxymethyldihydropteridine diphosphokinase [Peribacillus sp. SCS-155]|uniref:2-amino-4-hydroxy-6- hydroxymethyldihydropteridine diphosphokinase n=1 Tax=Peribacillus sedimenti TaxID=3115297 RepID=UPI0039057E66